MDYHPNAKCPLDGVRVLDLSRLVAGNMSTHVLADHGADVIKVEPPGKGDPLRDWGADGISVQWKIYARNKRSIVMNLRDARGKALLLDMVEAAQVFVENFRTGGLEKMGLSPETLWRRNPALIILRVTGFGQTGPYANRPGFGTLIEGMSGFAMKTGFPDRPPTLPNMALADMVAGLYGAFAVMTALREVERNDGKGQVIDLSLLEPLMSILGGDAALHHVTGKAPMRTGNRSLTASPRNTYETRDGRWLAISGSMQAMAMRLFRAIGREDMCEDPRYATNAARVARAGEVDAIVGEWVGARTLDENLKFFEEAEVTAGPVYDAGQLREDPHVLGREALVNMPDNDTPDGYLPMHNIIPRLSETPGAIRRPAPTLGQDTDVLLEELGLNTDRIAELRAAAVVA